MRVSLLVLVALPVLLLPDVEPEYACAFIIIADIDNEGRLSAITENKNMNKPNERFSPIIHYMRCVSNKQFKRFIVKIRTIFLLLDYSIVKAIIF
jgi:hypothetical protein